MSAPTSPSSQGSELRELYNSGLTQREIAERLGVTQKVVLLRMRREGIASRGQHRRPGRFGLHRSEGWKGEQASYGAKHWRVYVRRGSASGWLCAVCEARAAQDWANLGDYNDPENYAAMCRSCHRKFDRAMKHEADLSIPLHGDWRAGLGSRGARVPVRRTGRVRPSLYRCSRATLARRPAMGRCPRIHRCFLRRTHRNRDGHRTGIRIRHIARTRTGSIDRGGHLRWSRT